MRWRVTTRSGVDNPAEPEDFLITSGTVTFSAGIDVRRPVYQSFYVPMRDDNLNEGQEQFTLLLEVLAGPATTSLVLANTRDSVIFGDENDRAGVAFDFEVGDLAEGSATTWHITLSDSVPLVPWTMDYSETGDDVTDADYRLIAVSGVRFEATTIGGGYVHVEAGPLTKTFIVEIVDDGYNEAREELRLRFRRPKNREEIYTNAIDVSQTLTIPANDPTTYSMEASYPGIAEGTTAAFVVIAGGGTPTAPVTLAWSLEGTGVNPASASDFARVSGMVTVTPGEAPAIPIHAVRDRFAEENEQFRLNLDGASGGRPQGGGAIVTGRSSGLTMILYSLGSETMGLERAAYTIEEGKTTQVCVVASHPVQMDRDDFYLSLSTTATGSAVADSHYAAFSDRLVGPFNATTQRACTSVEALVNLHDGGVEDFSLELKKPAGLARVEISTASAAVTITKGDVVVAALSRESRFGGAVTDESEFSIILHVVLLDTDGGKNPIQSPWREGAIIEYRLSGTARSGTETDAARDYAVFYIPPDSSVYEPDAKSFDVASSTGTLPINVNSQRGEIILDLHQDNRNEDDEYVTIELLRVVTGSSRIRIFDYVSKTATTIIVDDDPIVVHVQPPPPAAEGTTAVYTVSLGAVPTRPVRVPYLVTTSTETTTPRAAPQDFVGTFPRAGALVFTEDDFATRSVSVPVSHDGLTEDAEYFHLVVTSSAITGSYGAARTPTTRSEATILASNQLDVSAGILPMDLFGGSGTEFDLAFDGVTLTIDLTDANGNLTTPTAPVAIAYRLSGTAVGGAARGAGIDYHYTFDYDEATSLGVAMITPSNRFPGRALLPITVVPDLVNEPSEEVRIELREVTMGGLLVSWPPTTPSASFTILDDDAIRYGVVVDRVRVSEDAQAVVRFTLEFREDNPRYALLRSAGDIEVPYTLTGSATYGEDYRVVGLSSSRTIPIAARETSTSFEVVVLDDASNEGSETITVSLGEPPIIGVGAGIVSRSATRGVATVVIERSDAVTYSVASLVSRVREGEDAEFVVGLEGGVAGAPITLTYAVSSSDPNPGGAADFVGAATGEVAIAAGVSSASLAIRVAQDARAESTETLTVRLTGVAVGDGGGVVVAGVTSASVEVSANAATLRTFRVTTRTEVASVGEGAVVGYVVTLSGAAPGADVDVAWGVAGIGVNPASSEDFVAVSGTVRFTPMDASGSTRGFVVGIAEDTLNEGDERYAVGLTMPDADSAVSGMPELTITDDVADRLELSISRIDAGDLSEGAVDAADRRAEFRVQVGASTATAAVTFSLTVTGSGVTSGDYGGVVDGAPLVIRAPSTRMVVVLEALDDNLNEGDEELIVGLDAGVRSAGAAGLVSDARMTTATATISRNDATLVSVSGVASVGVSEGSSAVFALSLSGGEATLPVLVEWRVTTGASVGEASDEDFERTSGVSEFAVGTTTVRVYVAIRSDGLAEGVETYDLRLSRARGGGGGGASVDAASGSATGTILASNQLDVSAGILPMDLFGGSGTEFDLAFDGVTLTIDLTDANGNLTTPTAPVAITYRLSGTAVGGAATEARRDYTWPVGYSSTASSGVAVITPSNRFPGRALLPITVVPDLVNEPSEEVRIELREVTMGGLLVSWPPTTPSASFTILDDDAIRYGVVVDRVRVSEDAQAVVRFTLEFREDNPRYALLRSAGDIEVPYTLTGSATYGEDYRVVGLSSSRTIPIAARETSTSFEVVVLDDASNEGSETITVSLGEPPVVSTGAGVVTRSATQFMATVVIERSDAVTYSVASLVSRVREGEDAEFVVGLEGGVAGAPITLTYAVSSSDPNPGGAADFVGAATGEVAIAAGVSSASLAIRVAQDARAESAETLTVRLTGVVVGAGGGVVVAGVTSASVEVSANAATLRTFRVTTRTEVASVGEGAVVGYVVTLSGAAPGADVDVAWGVAGIGVNPASSEDFVAVSGTVRFTPSDASGSTRGFVVGIAEDTLNEGDERYAVRLTMPDADSAVSGMPELTITDDVADRLELSISRIDAGDLSEGAVDAADRRAEFRVQVGASTATAAVTFSLTVTGSGVTSGDYGGVVDGAPLVIRAPSTRMVVVLEALDDNLNEGDEELIVGLDAGVRSAGAAGLVSDARMTTATATISRNDATLVSVSGVASVGVSEGSSAVFALSLSGGEATLPVLVEWRVTTGASVGEASDEDFERTSGVSEFAVGTTTVRVYVAIRSDGLAEGVETYDLRLSRARGGGGGGASVDAASGSATGTILANDPLAVSLSVLPANIPSDGLREAEYAVVPPAFRIGLLDAFGTPTRAPSPVAITYRLSGAAAGGTATEARRDYTWPVGYSAASASGVARITGAASSARVVVVVVDDMLNESSERVGIELLEVATGGALVSWPPPTTGTGFTILDDDAIGYGVVVDRARVSEAASSRATFTLELRSALNRPLASAGDVEVPYTLTGSAAYGEDYRVGLSSSGMIRLAAGSTSASFEVVVLDDASNEGSETITVSLGEPPVVSTGAGVVTRSATQFMATVVIERSDAVTYSVASLVSRVREGEDAEFVVGLEGGVAGAPITLTYAVSSSDPNPGGAADFVGAATGEVAIAAGVSSASLAIRVAQDARAESAETLTVRLTGVAVGAGGGVVVAGVTSASVEVSANAATLRTFRVTTRTEVASVGEGAVVGYVVTLSGAAPGADVDVAWGVAGIGVNPASSEDFVAVSGTVRFTPSDASGSTRGFVVGIAEDTLNEGDERYAVRLTMPDADSAVSGMPELTITDDVADRLELSISRIDAGDLSEGAVDAADRRAEFRVQVGASTATAAVTFSLTVTGSGVTSGDYGGVVDGAPLTIRAPSTRMVVVLEALDDNLNEGDEELIVGLDAGVRSAGAAGLVSDARMTTATATISRNDATLVSVSGVASVGVSEGSSAVFALSLSGGEATLPVLVEWRVTTGASVGEASDEDFERTSGVSEFAVGTTTVRVYVAIRSDGLAEGVETYDLRLSRARGGGGGGASVDAASGSATGTILANDPLTVSLSVLPANIPSDGLRETEYAGVPPAFRIGLLDAFGTPSRAPSPVAITYRLSGAAAGGTATEARRDYTWPVGYSAASASGVARITGAASSARVVVVVVDDVLNESSERVGIELLEVATGGALVSWPPPTTGTGFTILDDDAIGYGVVVDRARVSEASSSRATFTLELRGALNRPLASAGDVEVPYTLTGSAAYGEDYRVGLSSSGMIRLAAGSTSASFEVVVLDDASNEGSETITVSLGEPPVVSTGAGVVTRSATQFMATVVIERSDAVTYSVASLVSRVREGEDAEFVVGLEGGVAGAPITLTYAVSSSDPNPGGAADFVGAATGEVAIAAGVSSASLAIRVAQDARAESAETLTVRLTGVAVGAGGGVVVAGVTSASVEVSANAATLRTFRVTTRTEVASVGEGAVVGYVVTLSGAAPGADVDVAWGVAGIGVNPASSEDFMAVSGTVRFTPSDASGSTRGFVVGIAEDTLNEGDERYAVRLTMPDADSAVSGMPELTITDDVADRLELSISRIDAGDLSEGAVDAADRRAEFRVQVGASTATAAVTFSLTVTGSGVTSGDYGGVVDGAPLVIRAPSTRMVVVLEALDDNLNEGDEELIVGLDAGVRSAGAAGLVSDARMTTATATISRNDATLVSVSGVASVGVSEGSSAVFALSLSGGEATLPVLVEWRVTTGASVGEASDEDFERTSGVSEFAVGTTTVRVYVAIRSDGLAEGVETYDLRLSRARGGGGGGASVDAASGSATGTILANDPLTVSLSVLPANIPSDGLRETEYAVVPPAFRIGLLDAFGTPTRAPSPVAITYRLSGAAAGGTATEARRDYTWPVGYSAASASGVARITGAASSARVVVVVVDDMLNESSERVGIELLEVATGGALVSWPPPTTGTGFTILDDDAIGYGVVVDRARVSEAASSRATFTLELRSALNRPLASAGDVEVPYTLTGSAAYGEDYRVGLSSSGMIRLAAGSTSASFEVVVLDDASNEGSETITVSLGEPPIIGVGAGIVSRSATQFMATVVIERSDAVTYSVASLVSRVREGEDAEFVVGLEGGVAGAPITLTYAVSSSDPNPGGAADFVGAATGEVAIAAGVSSASLAIRVAQDARAESTETLTVRLTGVAVGAGGGVVVAGVTSASVEVSANAATLRTFRVTTRTEVASVGEGAVVGYVVTLSGAAPGADVDVAWGVAGIGVNPASSEDFVAVSGTVRFTPMDASGSTRGFVVGIAEDTLNEGDERYAVRLTMPDADSAVSGMPELTITDDVADRLELSISRIDAGDLSEGAVDAADRRAEFRVQVGASTATAAVTFSLTVTGSGVTSGDYGGVVDGAPLTIRAPSTRMVVVLEALDDNLNEGDEELIVGLDAGVRSAGAAGLVSDARMTTATATISRNDATLVSVSGVASVGVSEGSSAVFALSLSGGEATLPVLVEWRVTTGASVGEASDEDFERTSGVSEFAVGTTTVRVYVAIRSDGLAEGVETYDLRLSRARGGGGGGASVDAASGSATGTILANDPLTVSLSVLPANIPSDGLRETEYAVVPPAFRIGLLDAFGTPTRAPSPVAITYRLSGAAAGGTATEARRDYTWPVGYSAASASGVARITGAASSARVVVVVVDDMLNESSEGVGIELLGVATGGALVSWPPTTTGTGFTILDDDAIGYGVVVDRARVSEAASSRATFTLELRSALNRPLASAGDVEVPYTLTGSATYGEDYRAGLSSSGMIRLAAGSTSASFEVAVLDDASNEDSETITVSLGEPPIIGIGAGIVSRSATQFMATVVIERSDAVTYSVASLVSRVREGEDAEFVVGLEGGVAGAPITLTYAVSSSDPNPGGAADFVGAATGEVAIAAGVSSASLAIRVAQDARAESAETLTVRLTGVVVGAGGGVVVAGVTSASVEVSANAATLRTFRVTTRTEVASVGEGAVVGYVVTLSGAAPGADVDVAWGVAGIGVNPASSEDFVAVSGTVRFTPSDASGSTRGFVVGIAEDTLNEGDERYAVRLTMPDADSAVSGMPELTITDDVADRLELSISRIDAGDLSEGAVDAADRRAEFRVQVGASTATAAVTFSLTVTGSGVTSGDYGGVVDGAPLVIRAPSTRMVVVLEALDDNLNEGDEELIVGLDAGVRSAGAAGLVSDARMTTATATISRNDATLVSVEGTAQSVGVSEGSSAVFVLSLSGGEATLPVLVEWRVTTGASVGEASDEDFERTSGVSEFAVGTTTVRVYVAIRSDGLAEGVETYDLRLSRARGGGGGGASVDAASGSATGTILANDPLTVSLSAPSRRVEEGATAVFQVRLTNARNVPTRAPLPVTVEYALSGAAMGGAAGDVARDYDYPSGYGATTGTGTVTISTGTTDAAIALTVANDGRNEADEDIEITLLRLVAGSDVAGLATIVSAVVTVADADPIVAAVAARESRKNEGEDFLFTVTLSGGSREAPVTVPYRIMGIGADPAEATDWRDRSGGGIEIAATATTGLIIVRALIDDEGEGAEGLRVTLSTPTGVGVVGVARVDGARASATVEINPSMQINLSFALAGPADAAEGTTATYRVVFTGNGGRSAPPTTFTVTVTAVTAQGADFVGAGVATVADVVFSGEATGAAKSFGVALLDDDLSEGTETYRVVIAPVGGAPVITNDTVETAIAASDPLQVELVPPGVALRDEGAAGATTRVSFGVSLTPSPNVPDGDVVIRYALSGDAGAADYGDDTGGSVTVATGETTTQIRITIVGDDAYEPDEELVVALQSVQGANVSLSASSRASVTIVNDDPLPVVSFALEGPRRAAENTTATYVVTFTDSAGRSAPSTNVAIGVLAGAGVEGADFDGGVLPSRTLAFDGEASGSTKSFFVKIIDDSLSETTESYVVRISDAAVGASATVATAIARSNPLTTVLRRTAPVGAGARLEENAAATFVVEFRPFNHRAAGAVTMAWSATVDAQANTGAANAPGNADLSPDSGIARIEAGDTNAAFTVTARQDALAEGEETFTVGLGAVGAETGVGVVTPGASTTVQTTIAANAAATRFVSVRAPAGVTTVDEAALVTFTVELAGEAPEAGAPLLVDWNLAGEAEEGADYAAVATTALRFTTTGSQTVSVRLTDDQLNEAREALILEITGARGGGAPPPAVATSRALVWIIDDDPVAYRIGAAPGGFVSVSEAAGARPSLRVDLDRASAGDVRVSYTVVAGSAVGGVDYDGAAGVVTIGAGRTSTEFRPIAVIDDNRNEPTETLVVALDAAPIAQLDPRTGSVVPATSPPSRAEVRIIDDDAARYSIAALSSIVAEGATANFDAGLGNVVANAPVTLTYTVASSAPNPGDARADFHDPGDGRAVIAAGSGGTRVMVHVARDGVAEAAETLTLRLTGVAGTCAGCGIMGAGDPLSAQVTIPANATAARTFAVVTRSDVLRVAEGDAISYNVELDGAALVADVRLTWRVVGVGGNPTEAADFTAVTGAVTFTSGAAAGSTRAFTVSIASDTLNEGAEQYVILLETDDVDSAVAAPRFRTTVEDDAGDRIVLSISRIDGGDLSEGAVDAADRRAEFQIEAGNATATAVVTFSLTVSGSGVTSEDYGGVVSGASLTISPPSTRLVVTLEALDDDLNEGDETLRLALRGDGRSAGAVSLAAPPLAAAVATIARSDPTTVSLERTAVSDMGEADMARFAARLSGGRIARPVAMEWRVVTGSGAGRASNEDFGNMGGNLEIEAGRTRGEIGVALLEDNVREPDERYWVKLANPRGGGGAGVVLGVSQVSAIIRQLDRTPPVLEGVAYAPRQKHVWLKSVGDEALGILLPSEARLPDVLREDGVALDGFTMWTMVGGERRMIDVVSTSYHAPHAVVLNLAREISEDAGGLFADYVYPGDGLGIFDRALEAGVADARFGRSQIVSQIGITIPFSTTSDLDKDCFPDAAEARLNLNPLAPPTPKQQAEIPRVRLSRGVGGVAYIAYSGMRRENVATHLGVATTGATPVSLAAYYLSDTFGYSGAYPPGGYGCTGLFPANGYQQNLARGGCALVDFANVPTGVEHRIGWLAKGSSGYWHVTTGSGSATDSCLPEQRIWRVREVHVDDERLFFAPGAVATATLPVGARHDGAAAVAPLTLDFSNVAPAVNAVERTFSAEVSKGAGTRASTHGILDLRAGRSSVLWRADEAAGVLDPNRFSLGLATQTHVIRAVPANLPPALGRPRLMHGGGVRSVLVHGRAGYVLEVAAANLAARAAPEAFDESGALSGLTVTPRADSFEVGFDVRDGLATTTAALRVVAYAAGGASATVAYSWPLVAASNPLAEAARDTDGDGDGIPDAYDWWRASTEMRGALLPVPVSDRSRDSAGRYPGHHIRPALPLHRLRSGAETREHARERSAAGEPLRYGDYSAAMLGAATADYSFELYGVDHDVGEDGVARGGAGGVIIALPLYLREAGMHLSQAFDVSAGDGYGFARQGLSGGCPDDTRDAGSPYRDDAGNLKNSAGAPGDGCLALYIVDGGANDGDGVLNGSIREPFGRLIIMSGTGSFETSGGYFGFADLSLLALMLLLLLLLSLGGRNRRRKPAHGAARSSPRGTGERYCFGR